MYDELVNILLYDAGWLEQGMTQTEHDIAEHLKKAADAIEELQQTVDHYKGCSDDWYKEACDYKAAAPKWIPVTERLPEKKWEIPLQYQAIWSVRWKAILLR